jgi:hypothetical protein
VKGTLGAFSAIDGGYRPGITFTSSIGVPLGFIGNGVAADLFVQWRGTMTTATVYIPGPVPTAFWIERINIGMDFRW